MLLTPSQSNLYTVAGPGMHVAPFTDEIAAAIRTGVASPVHAAAVATAVFTGFPHRFSRGCRSALCRRMQRY